MALLNEAAVSLQSCVLSVRNAAAPEAANEIPPVVLTCTDTADVPPLIKTTATDPSTFWKAAVLTPDGAPRTPTRAAPGRA
ncbi:hypothetical protein RRF57_000555 [Xylaria bambusicola]|uniref:Uncharacterized protein n=1 Tax=Xylaria bambusicola TaxID=326684 RepID=A0AAN7UES1_9PEZI